MRNVSNIKTPIGCVLLIILLLLILTECEKYISITEFEADYEPKYKIEADFYPANPGKSVLRIDQTLPIHESGSGGHIEDAQAELRDAGDQLLSTFSWRDTAASYPVFIPLKEDTLSSSVPDFFRYGMSVDTTNYGAYKLDSLNFALIPGVRYNLYVTIDGEQFTTTFVPYPPVELDSLPIDTIVSRRCDQGPGRYQVLHTTLSGDSARLRWREDSNAFLYSVFMKETGADIPVMPKVTAFSGPLITPDVTPGTYDIIIGSMNRTFYYHYYYKGEPPGHPTRNFFDGNALGYAGTLNEIYLRVTVLP